MMRIFVLFGLLNLLAQVAWSEEVSVFDLPERRASLTAEEKAAIPSTADAIEVRDGVALIDEQHVAYNVERGIFAVRHVFNADADSKVCLEMGTAGDLVRQWYKEGIAAGLHGVLYDNHDGDHSNLDYGKFPQLTRVEYTEAARQRGLHLGLQRWFFHDAPVLGNSSMAATSGPYWGSMPRIALREPRLSALQYLQYTNNQLYFYPEHRDHDVDSHGDVYPANTPFVIISQGSSGSDRPFMHAAALTIAALPPATQQAVIKSKLLCPIVQMILRRSLKEIETDEDYLSGRAHPTVFDASQLDVQRMVRLAHELTPEKIPPLVALRVVEEDVTVPGVDYFEAQPAEKLLDTPCAIARIARAAQQRRRLLVRAAAAPETNEDVRYEWRLLRGDPQRVQLKPSNDGRECEVVVSWHERRPIRDGVELQSCRVDVGIFARRGEFYSAPSFISWLFPANEERTYDEQGRIMSIDRQAQDKAPRYVDPALVTPVVWCDDYRRDSQGRLLGWTRRRDGKTAEFTRDGALVQSKDDQGRPLQARTVRYVRQQSSPSAAPGLMQEPGDEILTYGYASAEDELGEIKRRESATP